MKITATGIVSLTCEVVQVPFDHVIDGADYQLALHAQKIVCLIGHSFGHKDAVIGAALGGISIYKVRELRRDGDLACKSDLWFKEAYLTANEWCINLDKKLEEKGVELKGETNPRATADLLLNKRERFTVSVVQLVKLARAYKVALQERDELIEKLKQAKG